jgi:hypothetical protein
LPTSLAAAVAKIKHAEAAHPQRGAIDKACFPPACG